MKKKIIASDKFRVSGPYSAAVEANDFIFISGQLPVHPETGEIIRDIRLAAKQVLLNIRAILEKTGLDLSDIVKTTVYLQDMRDFPVVNEVYAEFFPQNPPARSALEARVLPRGVPLEIEAIAVRK
ncbi:MAG TPA: Rid family detoxifying hydrolase [Smithella sp.]|nr:Rid family detoxifying hydrolase [Smithella sp.]HRS97612.1 Rid family detoxifying hydrolase [Smithella sp.]